MKKQNIRPLFLSLFVAIITLSFLGFKYQNKQGLMKTVDVGEFPVSEVLISLGDDKLQHHMATYDAGKAKIGEDFNSLRKNQD